MSAAQAATAADTWSGDKNGNAVARQTPAPKPTPAPTTPTAIQNGFVQSYVTLPDNLYGITNTIQTIFTQSGMQFTLDNNML